MAPPFKGKEEDFLAFIGNVDTAFVVTNSFQKAILYKFVLMHISGLPRMSISHRNLYN